MLLSHLYSFEKFKYGRQWEGLEELEVMLHIFHLPLNICASLFSSFQCCYCSVAQWLLTLCDPMICSVPATSPSLSPRVCSHSCPLSQWCHPTISSSVVPFSSCFQSFPGSGSFPMSQFFASGGQIIGASPSASVLQMNIQGWFPLGLTGLISLKSKRLSRVFSNTTVQKHQFFSIQLSLWSDSHIHISLLEKP